MLSPQHITKATAVALVAGAFAAPLASARGFGHYVGQDKQLSPSAQSQPVAADAAFTDPFAPIGSYSRQDKQLSPSTQSAPVTAATLSARVSDTPYSNRAIGSPFNSVSSPGSPAVVRATGSGDSFDWGDAGIGAGGALVLSIVAIGGGLVLVRRRPQRTGTTAAAIG
jgi:hypothetical protein